MIKQAIFICVAVGELDVTLTKNRDFHEHLNALSIPHDAEAVSGVEHSTPTFLAGLGASKWAFYAEALGGAAGTRRA